LVHGKPAHGPRLPIHPPRRHPGVERRLERRDQLLKLVERQAREIQELYRAGLQLGKPWSRRTASMLPLDSGFPPSAPRTGQVAFPTSGGSIPAALRIFAFSIAFGYESLVLSLRRSECPECLDPLPKPAGSPPLTRLQNRT